MGATFPIAAEWLADVRSATEDTVLALADHLPAEAAEAVLELATGGKPRKPQPVEPAASPLDMPSLGSVISKLRPPATPIFPYVTLGILSHLGNHDSMGQDAGCLGKVYDPFMIPFVRPTPDGTLDLHAATSVLGQADGPQVGRRRQLLEEMTRAAPASTMPTMNPARS